MKTNKIQLLLVAALAAVLTACSPEWTSRNPLGSGMVQEQFEKVPDGLPALMRGVYTMMYTFSDHDEFGHRSIDMYGDMLSGDMALTAQTYAWFYQDENGTTATARSGYIWTYYYDIIHNVNLVTKTVKNASTFVQHWEEFGAPTEGLEVHKLVNGEDQVVYTYTDAEVSIANIYAQALTMRGYSYAGLIRFFRPTIEHLGGNLTNAKGLPLYTEDNMDKANVSDNLALVYERAEKDLETAIAIFEGFEDYFVRANKLEADVNVARGLLAYSYLNKSTDNTAAVYSRRALDNALAVINSGAYSMLPYAELTTNGFNNVTSKNWMWGEDVVIETATGLGSFWGQVDIHSYSYAWSGDTKVVDQNLYEAIPSWDGRKKWFNDGSKKKTYEFCPDGKFYSSVFESADKASTEAEKIDREWLSDNVFMRYESMYLIAAEACYNMHNYDSAAMFIRELLAERADLNDAEYQAYDASLANPTNLFLAIYHNWRLEMWGEGYGLQTFRRLQGKYQIVAGEKIRRGANHLYDKSKEIEYTTDESSEWKYTIYIPTSESLYNPEMGE